MDLILIAEVAWCTLLVGNRGLERSLLGLAGMLSSSYAASQLSGWLANTFAAQNTPAFTWVEHHLDQTTNAVGLSNVILPAKPTGVMTGLSHSHWLALQVFHGLLFGIMTFAIFSIFVITAYVAQAIWDLPSREAHGWRKVAVEGCGVICGVVASIHTALIIGDLSWLQALQPFSDLIRSSAYLQGLSSVILYLEQHVSVFT